MPIINLPGLTLYELLFLFQLVIVGLVVIILIAKVLFFRLPGVIIAFGGLVPHGKPIMGWNSVHRCLRHITREKMT